MTHFTPKDTLHSLTKNLTLISQKWKSIPFCTIFLFLDHNLPDIKTRSCSSGNISIWDTFLLSPMRDEPEIKMTNKHKKHENWGVNLGLWDCPKLVHLIPSVNSEIAAPVFQIVERSPIEKGGLGTVKKKESGLGRVAFRTPRTGTYFLSSIQCRRDHLLYPNTLGQCLLLLHRVLVWSVDWTRWLLWPGKLAVCKTKSQSVNYNIQVSLNI